MSQAPETTDKMPAFVELNIQWGVRHEIERKGKIRHQDLGGALGINMEVNFKQRVWGK